MKEIEQKFIVRLPVGEIKSQIDDAVRGSTFTQDEWYSTDRIFDYYDTPQLDLLRTGQTLREVSGFEKGVRYDLKSGPIVDRNESSVWANGKDIAPMLHVLGAKVALKGVPMHYDKCIIHKDETVIECGIDTTPYYTEIEFELEHGRREVLDEFCESFHENGNFEPGDVQKYLRTWVMSHPQLNVLQHQQQDCRWHTDTVLEHTLQTVQELQAVLKEFPSNRSYGLFLTTVFHDVGKINPEIVNGDIKFPGHEEIGASIADLSEHGLGELEECSIRKLIEDHGHLGRCILEGPVDWVQNIPDQARISLADLRASNLQRDYAEEFRERESRLIQLITEGKNEHR